MRVSEREKQCIISSIVLAIDASDDDALVDCLDIAAVFSITVHDIYGNDSEKTALFTQYCKRAITSLRIQKLEFSNVSCLAVYLYHVVHVVNVL